MGCASWRKSSPTIRQRELGTRLRQMRNERGMTVEEVAASLLCSATKMAWDSYSYGEPQSSAVTSIGFGT
jgi:hypothetical protein